MSFVVKLVLVFLALFGIILGFLISFCPKKGGLAKTDVEERFTKARESVTEIVVRREGENVTKTRSASAIPVRNCAVFGVLVTAKEPVGSLDILEITAKVFYRDPRNGSRVIVPKEAEITYIKLNERLAFIRVPKVIDTFNDRLGEFGILKSSDEKVKVGDNVREISSLFGTGNKWVLGIRENGDIIVGHGEKDFFNSNDMSLGSAVLNEKGFLVGIKVGNEELVEGGWVSIIIPWVKVEEFLLEYDEAMKKIEARGN